MRITVFWLFGCTHGLKKVAVMEGTVHGSVARAVGTVVDDLHLLQDARDSFTLQVLNTELHEAPMKHP